MQRHHRPSVLRKACRIWPQRANGRFSAMKAAASVAPSGRRKFKTGAATWTLGRITDTQRHQSLIRLDSLRLINCKLIIRQQAQLSVTLLRTKNRQTRPLPHTQDQRFQRANRTKGSLWIMFSSQNSSRSMLLSMATIWQARTWNLTRVCMRNKRMTFNSLTTVSLMSSEMNLTRPQVSIDQLSSRPRTHDLFKTHMAVPYLTKPPLCPSIEPRPLQRWQMLLQRIWPTTLTEKLNSHQRIPRCRGPLLVRRVPAAPIDRFLREKSTRRREQQPCTKRTTSLNKMRSIKALIKLWTYRMPLRWLPRRLNCNNRCLASRRTVVWLLLDINSNNSLWKMVKFRYIWARHRHPKSIMPAQRCKYASLCPATMLEWSRLWPSKAPLKSPWRSSNCPSKEGHTNLNSSPRPSLSTRMSSQLASRWAEQPTFRVCPSQVCLLSQS